jgi:hypothetical protein
MCVMNISPSAYMLPFENYSLDFDEISYIRSSWNYRHTIPTVLCGARTDCYRLILKQLIMPSKIDEIYKIHRLAFKMNYRLNETLFYIMNVALTGI